MEGRGLAGDTGSGMAVRAYGVMGGRVGGFWVCSKQVVLVLDQVQER